MDVEVVAGGTSSSSPAQAPAPAAAASGNTNSSPAFVTQTRYNTQTITMPTSVPPAQNTPVGIVYTTVYTEKIITVTRTIS